jgi:methyl-accepting chemotaxis protein
MNSITIYYRENQLPNQNHTSSREELAGKDYFLAQSRQTALAFIAIMMGALFFIIILLFVLIKNYPAGFGAIVAFSISGGCLLLVIKGLRKIGSAIFLITLMIVLYGLSVSGFGDDFVAKQVSIIGLALIVIMPSGTLVNSVFSIVYTLIHAVLFIVICFISGQEMVITRLPLYGIVYAFAGALTFYLTRIQNSLLNRISSDAQTSKSMIEEIQMMLRTITRLKQDTDKSQDEISMQLSDIESIIITYNSSILELADSSSGMTDKIQETQQSLAEVSTEISNINTQIATQTELVQQNSASQNESFVAIQSISSNVKQADSINSELMQLAQKGRVNLDEALQSIDELSSYQHQMLEVTKVISTISSQTNLLSMNASIEAAHAGSAGAGFTVVAEEIRNLADSTAQRTREISELIQNMNIKIDHSTEFVQKVATSLLDITSQVNASNPVITEISNAMDEVLIAIQQSRDDTIKLDEISLSIKESAGHEQVITSDYEQTFNGMKQQIEQLVAVIDKVKSYTTQSQAIIDNIKLVRQQTESVNTSINTLLAGFAENISKSDELADKPGDTAEQDTATYSGE